MSTEKIKENLLRRISKRQGLELQKCRRRDRRAIGFGTWQLVDHGGRLVLGDDTFGYGASLEDVEAYLDKEEHR